MAYTTINDPSAYFQALLYTGNSSTQSVTFDGNSDLQPDWVWTKCRSNASDNFVFDSTRGVHKRIFTNTTAAEVTNTNALTSFDSDGFSMGTVGGMNFSSQTYVGWGWKSNGGTTSSNTDGSITSTVQADTTAGFSIVTWTGTTSNGTVGHGLGKAPDCIFFKNYAAAENWTTYHSVLGNSGGLYLNLNNSFNTASSWYSDTSPTSDYFYVGTNTKTNGGTMVAYCFADTQGYSKFGSYSGNGNADGPFVYTGFKPAWLLTKRTDVGDNWRLVDSTRYPFNDNSATCLQPNQTNNETDSGARNLDLLSNGFKVRTTDPDSNSGDGGSNYLYMAFAENPLVATNNTIALAR
jgi:hypothetical protein